MRGECEIPKVENAAHVQMEDIGWSIAQEDGEFAVCAGMMNARLTRALVWREINDGALVTR